jgi:phytoene dehydrogenase-like protein
VAGDFRGRGSPGSTATLLLAEAATGPGVEGGGAAIASALEKAARAHGVEIRTGARVVQIACDKGAVAGVELAGGERVAPTGSRPVPPAHRLPRPPAAGGHRLPAARAHRQLPRSRGTTAQVLLAVDKAARCPRARRAGPDRRPCR